MQTGWVPSTPYPQVPASMVRQPRTSAPRFEGLKLFSVKPPQPQVSPQVLRTHVEALAKLPRHFADLEGLNQAADYIANQWKQMGLTVKTEPFQADGQDYRNLMVSFGPENAPRFIIGAHYDVCITQFPGGHKPGADDNASGVAGILELSRLLQQHNPNLKYRVDVVAFTNEEPPYFRTNAMGSAVHARNVKASYAPVKGMIAVDMIGYYSDQKDSQGYPLKLLKLFYPNKGNFLGVVGDFGALGMVRKTKKALQKYMSLPVRSISGPRQLPGIDFSDHLNFRKFDWPAVMLTDTAFYRNSNYHRESDTPDTLNYDKMAEVVKGLYGLVTHLK